MREDKEIDTEYGVTGVPKERRSCNEISELRNTALSPRDLNTAVAIVTSSPAEPLGNGVPTGVYYLPTESGVPT